MCLSPCFLHCCQPWYCSSLSASWPLSPQKLHPGHWAERLYLRNEVQSEQRMLLSAECLAHYAVTFKDHPLLHMRADSEHWCGCRWNQCSVLGYSCKSVTFRCVNQNLDIFEDSQAEQPLSSDMSSFHHLKKDLCGYLWISDRLTETTVMPSWKVELWYIHQWDFWHGKHQRSHSQADPLWFSPDPGCSHAGQPPVIKDKSHIVTKNLFSFKNCYF